ncbi:MAG: hypothetical protein K2W33_03025 [Burkholderiales bacterium]|nr:hypothetical protein [Burkholderiales bacterium]
MTPATPAIVTQAGAQRLPRWALLCLCAAYILPGFVGREPWKNADTAAYGIMNWMALGVIDWWNPAIPGQEYASTGLLPHWLGALMVMAWPEQADWVYRLPALVAVSATLYFTWHAVFRFALLGSAQPVSFAFGGQAAPVDYARAVADSGLLALMGSLGLAQLSHEATPDTFLLAALTAVLYAIARMAHPSDKPDRLALACWSGGLFAMGMSGMPWLTVCTAVAVPGWYLLHTAMATRDRAIQPVGNRPTLMVAIAAGAATMLCVLCWTVPWARPTPTEAPFPFSLASFVKMLAWFTWPLWPLVLWTLWRWRQHVRQAHVGLPLLLTLLVVAASVWESGSDRVLLLALPSLSVLAAFALPTLKRSVSALIDWFSVLFFSLCATVVWVVWIAMVTGVPEKPAANVARLAPGFVPSFELFAFAVALLATLCWLAVVAWRVTRHPPAIWKSMVLPATGGTLCWLLLMTLWLPLLDHARSYGPIARRLAAQIPESTCAATLGLSTVQMAGLAHQGRIQIDLRPADDSDCAHLIASPNHPDVATATRSGWQLVARFNRLTDNKESLLLLRRSATPADSLVPYVSEDGD